ncbi:Rhodanese/Cell cycle control phosphatase superfamily protein [Euphorbia peplus]|nr:Rhodanese/Cell cycle control phosphatase superfamily protein [Euphorbia peplus]
MSISLNHNLCTHTLNHANQPNLPFYALQRQVKFQTRAATNLRELIQSGEVKPIPAKDAAIAISSDGFTLLDIRPEWETSKAKVAGSLNVPLFIQDMNNSPLTLLKKWVHFGYIGLWTGQNFTTINPEFLQQVEASVPDKNAKLLVACGEGLRSIIAATKLYEGGYKNLGWLAGGFNRAKDGDFPAIEGPEKLQYATIGGVSYFFLKLLVLLQAVGKDDNRNN